MYGLILRILHRLCRHDPANVEADITEGELGIEWCRTCGAINVGGSWDLAVDPFARGATSNEHGIKDLEVTS